MDEVQGVVVQFIFCLCMWVMDEAYSLLFEGGLKTFYFSVQNINI
jgi:hypothetical protein